MKSKTPRSKNAQKKPYRPPRLVVYGDLRRLTETKGGGNNDGLGKPRTKLGGGPT